MEGRYTVWFGKEPVGQVTVERQGLYYCFRCQCQLHTEVMCRVSVSCGGKHVSLGILVPVGNDYLLNKKIPVKQFLPGNPEFWIAPRQMQKQKICLDIYPEEPFQYITKLEHAYLDKIGGRPVVILHD